MDIWCFWWQLWWPIRICRSVRNSHACQFKLIEPALHISLAAGQYRYVLWLFHVACTFACPEASSGPGSGPTGSKKDEFAVRKFWQTNPQEGHTWLDGREGAGARAQRKCFWHGTLTCCEQVAHTSCYGAMQNCANPMQNCANLMQNCTNPMKCCEITCNVVGMRNNMQCCFTNMPNYAKLC